MQSLFKLSNSSFPIKPISFNNLGQYSVSLDSFNAIPNLFIKSFLVYALCDSDTFAPVVQHVYDFSIGTNKTLQS